jgi:hypothetical protein
VDFLVAAQIVRGEIFLTLNDKEELIDHAVDMLSLIEDSVRLLKERERDEAMHRDCVENG